MIRWLLTTFVAVAVLSAGLGSVAADATGTMLWTQDFASPL